MTMMTTKDTRPGMERPEDVCKKVLGQRVKHLRETYDLDDPDGWSMGHLAKVAGVSRDTIIRIENGLGCTELPVIIKLARVFNVSTDYLLGWAPVPSATFEQCGDLRDKILALRVEIERLLEEPKKLSLEGLEGWLYVMKRMGPELSSLEWAMQFPQGIIERERVEYGHERVDRVRAAAA